MKNSGLLRIYERLKLGFFYYWIFGIIGSVIESIWYAYLKFYINPDEKIPPFLTITPIRATYGIAGALIVWILIPLIEKNNSRFKIFFAYLISVIIAVIVETSAGLILILIFGHNPLWDYSKNPYNLFGLICLENSVLFGFIGVIFVYVIYYQVEKFKKRFTDSHLRQFQYFIVSSYSIDVIFLIIRFIIKQPLLLLI